jgi:hypothetical protein
MTTPNQLARTLQLNEEEQAHLYALANPLAGRAVRKPTRAPV